jgi:DNA modification methylase
MIYWPRESSKGAKVKSKSFCKNTDVILFYTKSDNYQFNKIFIPYSDDYIKKRFKTDDKGRRFMDVALGTRLSTSTLEELEEQERIYTTRTDGKRYKKYLEEMSGVAIGDIWSDIYPLNSMSHEKKGYDTQKPIALMDRIIDSSSNEGDLVADFFCGSGSFLVSAQNKKRNYIGCDTSPEAYKTATEWLRRK